MRQILYSFARASITLRQIELRGSNLDTFEAEEQGYLAAHFARLESLVSIVFLARFLAGIYFRIGRTMVIIPFWTANHQP